MFPSSGRKLGKIKAIEIAFSKISEINEAYKFVYDAKTLPYLEGVSVRFWSSEVWGVLCLGFYVVEWASSDTRLSFQWQYVFNGSAETSCNRSYDWLECAVSVLRSAPFELLLLSVCGAGSELIWPGAGRPSQRLLGRRCWYPYVPEWFRYACSRCSTTLPSQEAIPVILYTYNLE